MDPLTIIFIVLTWVVGPVGIIFYFSYEFFYYKGDRFNEIKSNIKEYIDNCNQLNEHIEELKRSYINFKQLDFGQGNLVDYSRYNYRRPGLRQIQESPNVYNCSLTVCRNAQQQPFKYLCKYFQIKKDETTLANFEKVLNDFSAAEQGKILLKKERDRILSNISSHIPIIIRIWGKKKLFRKLGFEDIDFSQLYFPKFSFRYVSGGGNSSMSFDIEFNLDTLNRFINYLSGEIKFRQSVAGQRALMTTGLREKIKRRDNYTCQKCGLSTKDEPNLLLEIDHIIPLSKKGMTTESNLQTLCWKCNRTKGAKLENHI